ncbi:MAG: hypothetical protein ACI8T1_002132 [Verrucomicrobiales bacterium]|jgi:hypothetical protein
MSQTSLIYVAVLVLGLTSVKAELSAERRLPILPQSVVFEESDGIVAVEAEHFFKQTDTEVRGW